MSAASVGFLGLALGSGCWVESESDEGEETEEVLESVGETTDELKECIPSCGIMGTSCGHQDDGCGGTVWCGTCACPSTFRACEVGIPTIYETPITLTAGVPFEVWTSGLSAGADSVIHIVDAATGSELTMNDNFGGAASKVIYTSSTTRDAIVIVRAKSNATQGTATFNTHVGSLPITLGAYEQLVQAPRNGDSFETARMPNDPGTMHVAYVMNGENISKRRTGGGASGAVSFPLTASSGTTRLIVGQSHFSFSVGTSPAGRARIVRNDKNVPFSWIGNHDADNDGLGYELEAALGTCAALSGTATGPDGVAFNCATATDARDTDGDGLFDGWEVLGRKHASGDLPLSKWGAKPRKKDIFLEADFGKETPSETPKKTSAATARTMVKIFADRFATISSAQNTAHAASIKNPDGTRGVALHVDSGVAPESSSEATHYGDWGGYSVVPHVLDAMGNPKSMPASQAYPTYMHPARVGVFRYWVGSVGGGGQTFVGAPFYNAGYDAASTSAHELGHNVMTGSHSGIPTSVDVDPNCKPNYASVMNYAFGGAGFTGGDNAPTLNNASLQETGVANPSTMQEFLIGAEASFGYKVDLATGSVDWNRDGVFSPSNVRVRAYANSQSGNSCQYVRYNATTLATNTTTLSPALTRFGTRTFIFYGGTNQLRYAVSSSALGCSATSTQPCANFTTNGTFPMDTTGGVDAIHLTGPETTVVVARGADGVLRTARITGLSGENPLWSSVVALNGPIAAGEPALAKDLDGSALLVFRDAAGLLYQRSFVSGAWTATSPVLGANGLQIAMSSVKSSPGIGVANVPVTGLTPSPRMYAIFADTSENMRLYYRDVDGRFKTRAVEGFEMTGRPQIQWVPDPLDLTLGGRMIIASTTKEWNGPEEKNIWVLRSHVDKNAPNEIRIGLWQGYDSMWTSSYGIDLMFEPGIDTNLRAAWTLSMNYPDVSVRQKVRFDPKADGINDFVYGPSSDWRVMRVKMCQNFAAVNGVTCPAQDW